MAHLAEVIAGVVQGANQFHHDAHAVLWPGVKLAAHLGVVEGVSGVSDGIACLPCADGDEGVTTCRSIRGVKIGPASHLAGASPPTDTATIPTPTKLYPT